MIQRIFWGWDKPVLQRAAEHLMQGWTVGELDLSSTLILVPTTEAGRRLKEALAVATGVAQGAVTAPHVWSPEMALFPGVDREQAASAMQSRLAWARVMMDVDLSQFPKVFPQNQEQRGWSWALSAADLMQDLMMTLGAGGLNFSSVVGSPHVQQDVERWEELARLEALYLQQLAAVQRKEVQRSKAERAAAPLWPEGVERVVVMAVLDAPPLFGQWLRAAAQRLPVVVCVHAPAELAHAFDDWGRPLPEFWEDAGRLPAPVPVSYMTVAQGAAQQADHVVDALREMVPLGRTALGLCDAEVISCVKDRLAMEEVRVFEPGGVPPQTLGLWHILQLMKDLVVADSWRAFTAMLRVPDLRKMLAGEQGQQVLREADDFSAERMPLTLSHALELAAALPRKANDLLLPAMRKAAELADTFQRQTLPASLRALFTELYGERSFQRSAPRDRSLLELTEAALELADELADEVITFGLKPSAGELFSLLMTELGNTQVTEPRGEVDLVLLGWLELLWESAPQLIVAGFNEEHVPGILLSHPFLPDSVRMKLGLPCQATRYARDASLLHVLAAQRLPGALRVICGQWGERGESLKPSRLLMRGPVELLPEQVRVLFPKDEELPPPEQLVRSLAWKLKPEMKPIPEMKKISVSALNAYLSCPFRYYLSYVLGMSSVAADKQEMDAGEYGTLIHLALQRLAEDEEMKRCEDGGRIASFLQKVAEQEALRQYGDPLPTIVQLQVDSILHRLAAVAEVEAEQRRDGWRILRSELNLAEIPEDRALIIEGVRVTGKVDRVEQKGTTLRILDYKTSDRGKDVKTAMRKRINSKTKQVRDEDAWQVYEDTEGSYQWLDLQLPLYAAALSKINYSNAELAYVVMPASVMETKLQSLEDYSPVLQDAAVECAAEAIRRIKAGIFWPPNPRVKYDDYAELLLGDPQLAVDAGALGR